MSGLRGWRRRGKVGRTREPSSTCRRGNGRLLTLPCWSSPPRPAAVHWSQPLERPNPFTRFLPACSPEAPLSPPVQPLGAPFPPTPRVPSLRPKSPVSLGCTPQSCFWGCPFFRPKSPGCFPLLPPANSLHRVSPPLKQRTLGQGLRHSGAHRSHGPSGHSSSGPAADHVEPKGWGLIRERPGGTEARGCRCEPASSMSRIGRNFHVCRADNREEVFFPENLLQKSAICCLAGVRASPGPGGYHPSLSDII